MEVRDWQGDSHARNRLDADFEHSRSMTHSGVRPHMAALIEDMELHRARYEGGVSVSSNAGQGGVVSAEDTGRVKVKVSAALNDESTTPSSE